MKYRAFFAALVAVLPACGLFGPRGPLEETAERLGDIRSGTLRLELRATTAAGAISGFVVQGPFSIPAGASLPAARLDYRQLGGEQPRPLEFVSTGKAAYIEVGERAYQLPPDRTAGLRGDDKTGETGPFDTLKISGWVRDQKASAGPRIDGVGTQVVRGKLDVPAALNNIFDIARELGRQDLPRLEGKEAERLSRAVRSATMELVTGTSDRLLRRLSVRVNLGSEAPKELGEGIRKLLGVEFRLSLSIQRPNEPVRISPPENPLPLSRLE